MAITEHQYCGGDLFSMYLDDQGRMVMSKIAPGDTISTALARKLFDKAMSGDHVCTNCKTDAERAVIQAALEWSLRHEMAYERDRELTNAINALRAERVPQPKYRITEGPYIHGPDFVAAVTSTSLEASERMAQRIAAALNAQEEKK